MTLREALDDAGFAMAETVEVLQRAGTSTASRSGRTTAWSATRAS